MADAADITRRVKELAALPDSMIRLAQAALLIAKFEYPDLDDSRYIDRLDELAAKLEPRVQGIGDRSLVLAQLNRLLFEEEGFRGNTADYYDPRNSFLNEVLDRKLGIPITLSIVYMEVGRRIGLPLYGIGLPGHFITGLLTEEGRLLVDPFYEGRILTEEECRQMVQSQGSTGRDFVLSLLDPVWPKQILVRLMRNLKGIYWNANQQIKALYMIEWILAIEPSAAGELRDRGFINEALGDVKKAAGDLEAYLELSPQAQDRETITAILNRLKTQKVTIH